jgi:xylulokinase
VTRSPLLLGIDLGTSSVKVLLADGAGRVQGLGEAPYPIRRPGPGRAEQVPAEWWAAARVAVTDALRATGDPCAGGRVAAIGLDGQMHGTVLVDRSGEALGTAIIWPDQRSRAEVAELTAELGPGRVIEAVGGPLAAGFQAPTIRWLREHEPARWDRMATVLPPKDWLRHRLTGELATDPSDGSGTGFLEARSRAWWPPMLRAVGVDPERLPPILDATAAAAPLLPAAAAELGLVAGIPVAVGAGDTPAGLLGAGLVAPDALLVTISTGGQVAVPAFDVSTDALGRAHTFGGALPPSPGVAGWYRMAGVLSAGAALRWLRDDVLGPDGAGGYARMTAWAADVTPGADGLLFLPYLAGERSPHMDPGARGMFVGLTARHGRAELVRAVLEGVAFACLDAASCLADAGALTPALTLGGGGARSPAWSGIVADVFGRPVRRLVTDAGAAVGACILAGAAAGHLDPVAAAREWVALEPPIEPDAARRDRYRELFALFRETHRMTAGIEHRLGAIATVA